MGGSGARWQFLVSGCTQEQAVQRSSAREEKPVEIQVFLRRRRYLYFDSRWSSQGVSACCWWGHVSPLQRGEAARGRQAQQCPGMLSAGPGGIRVPRDSYAQLVTWPLGTYMAEDPCRTTVGGRARAGGLG